MTYLDLPAGIDVRVYLDEERDCTVKATAAVLGITYAEAHAKMKALGRKDRRRFKFKKVYADLGLELRPDLSCRTVEKILPELRNGRFVIRVSRHVFAVVDGQVHDMPPAKPKSRVLMVYELPDRVSG
jgi:hypothetical protein